MPKRIESRPEDETTRRALDAAAGVLCRRWHPLILWMLRDRPRRFSELAARLPNATPKVLTDSLRQLERDEIVSRWRAARGPRRTEYALTAWGTTLAPVIDAMMAWGERYLGYRTASRASERAPARRAAREPPSAGPTRANTPDEGERSEVSEKRPRRPDAPPNDSPNETNS